MDCFQHDIKQTNTTHSTSTTQRHTIPQQERVFELGERAALLERADDPAVAPSVAEAEGRPLPYEAVFRSVGRLLADAASAEYLFCLDFWGDEPLAREVIAPAVAAVEADLAERLQQQHDPIAVLLMTRLNAELRRLMARRRVPVLDDHLDRVSLLLWPRFKVLWDAQRASVRPGAERALFTSDAGAAPVARRYAALVASALRLMARAGDEAGGGDDDGARGVCLRAWLCVCVHGCTERNKHKH